MKIRTDFVTNSSSSSFVVSLNLQLSDGTSIVIDNHEDFGDLNTKGCKFVAKDSAGQTIAAGECDPCEYCMTEMDLEPDDIPLEVDDQVSIIVNGHTLNLIGISSAKNISTLITAITKPFALDSHFTDDDDEDCIVEYEDETAEEIVNELKARFNTMVDDCNSVLAAHLTKVSDLTSATVSMEFSGRGEFLADRNEIIEHIFNYWERDEIINILSEDDEEEILEKLRDLKCLENFTDDALSTLVNFWKNCDYAPDMCNVTQTLREDGKIDLTITW